MRPEDVIADRRRPYTGAEYIQSLRDGRDEVDMAGAVEGKHGAGAKDEHQAYDGR